ncbi:YdcF family protein [Micromonospora sp. R77]|uniref:YdcF family protein n=1 Tax=Micromonospora sp. R77 TaxID=2925836 RepID=UPI001F5FFFBB|nr:YdcF family protein [Micromonospora sp. R77]MCI4065679.1 YdcF family protein [Micromonospora sp. R77]
MTAPTALTLVVFGRGVHCVDGGYALTPASVARVRAAVDYVLAHRSSFLGAAAGGGSPRIVFTGGWAEACEGAPPPPDGSREGDLMLREARSAGLDRYADLRAETRSRSTLENLVNAVQDGLLSGADFDARRPLGIVSHAWHLPRVRFLAGKVLGLHGPALLDVPVGGRVDRGRSERVARIASRLAFLGVGDVPALLRRERTMVAALRRAERLLRRARGGAVQTAGPGDRNDARRGARRGM